VPPIDGVRWQTNESPDEVHAALLKNIDNVTPQQIPVLLTETLMKVKHTTMIGKGSSKSMRKIIPDIEE
jgi:hypothetical protein